LSDSVYVRAIKERRSTAPVTATWPTGDGNLALTSILRCPLTQRPLRVAGPGELITDDGSVTYPIIDGIPVLLTSEARRVSGATS
jgi:uncharacterized protein YbaR (Trm112 family)